MTINVDSIIETVSVNNIAIPQTGLFILTSGFSKVPVPLAFTRLSQNARYSTIDITFPQEFKDEHKNGVYFYSIEDDNGIPFEAGYVKIITEPGGTNGSVAYTANTETENRESKVYYRPQY